MPQSKPLADSFTVDGETLRRAFEAATRCLERYRDAINALNVFPVPDGDTGTNMLLTMRSAGEEAQYIATPSVGEVMEATAHGALLGARGNSGVILSQFLKGMATATEGKDRLTAEDVAQSLSLASQMAYAAMSKPVEGTMLTVIRELSLAAQESATSGADRPVAVLQAATREAKAALARTPLQLPVLKEAGVVDAGGQGIALLLEAITSHLAGERVEDNEFEISAPTGVEPLAVGAIHEDFLAATEEEEYGYCIQFLLRGQSLHIPEIRERLVAMADSTVAVGDESLAKLHVHAADPGPVLSYATSLGSISQVRIDNIEEQRREFVAYHRSQRETSQITVVAVAQGEGFARLFRELGCQIVVNGGQSMNPSTQELMEAARLSAGAEVILLPNNSNIILAANQATSLFGPELHVVASTTIPQGIAALLAFNEEEPLPSNLKAMEEALGSVKTIEVTVAVRPTSLEGLDVAKGQHIALADGQIVAAGDSPWEVLHEALKRDGAGRGAHVTLYWGADVDEGDTNDMAARLSTSFPGVEVEVHNGGQPYYQYIVSVE